jgi:anti-sigma factor RsiW
MNRQQSMEEQLWEYIDGTATTEDRQRIDTLLQSQAEWKDKYSELLEINQLLHSSEMEAPSLRCDGRNHPSADCSGYQILY